MKTILIYSGKGGVGKTTTTANIARALVESGKKVLIIDGDINTPSMSVLFKTNNPIENLWVHSTGHIFDSLIYFEKSMVRKFINDALNLCSNINPDVILIDTPPSITDVHIEIMELMKISLIYLVTQPNKLSLSDVIRTAKFFSEKCKSAPVYIVENMSFGEDVVMPLPCKAKISFAEGMKGDTLYDTHTKEYKYLAELCLTAGDVQQRIQANLLFDESYQITDIRRMGGFNKSSYMLECTYDDGNIKSRPLSKLRFQNVRSWGVVRDELMDDHYSMPFAHNDNTLRELTEERVSRLVTAFKNDTDAYFMITKAPCTEIIVFPGEIGIATIVCDESFYGVPRLQYQTKQGQLILFAYEAIPVQMSELNAYINEGYKLQPDGRYIPTKEHLEMVYNSFGNRVGMGDNWERNYDTLYGEDKPNSKLV